MRLVNLAASFSVSSVEPVSTTISSSAASFTLSMEWGRSSAPFFTIQHAETRMGPPETRCSRWKSPGPKGREAPPLRERKPSAAVSSPLKGTCCSGEGAASLRLHPAAQAACSSTSDSAMGAPFASRGISCKDAFAAAATAPARSSVCRRDQLRTPSFVGRHGTVLPDRASCCRCLSRGRAASSSSLSHRP